MTILPDNFRGTREDCKRASEVQTAAELVAILREEKAICISVAEMLVLENAGWNVDWYFAGAGVSSITDPQGTIVIFDYKNPPKIRQ